MLTSQTPYYHTFGVEGDVSGSCNFGWYEWGYFREQKAQLPFPKEVLCRALGPAKNEGNEMCQWVLKSNGKIIPRRSSRPLAVAELSSESEQGKRKALGSAMQKKLGGSMPPPSPSAHAKEAWWLNASSQP